MQAVGHGEISFIFVTMAVEGAFDLGVILSTDTDLVPALEYVGNQLQGKCHVA